MSGGRDVNALWEALKAQSAPTRRTQGGASLSGLGGIPGVKSTVRTFDKSRGAGPAPGARPSFIAQLGEGCRGAGGQQQGGSNHQALLVRRCRRYYLPGALTAACAAAAWPASILSIH